MTKIDSKIPEGPVAEKWTNYKAHQKLVNPANKRRLDIIVVGTGLAGASAAASLGEMGFRVFNFCIQDSPRRAHSIAAQGGINAAKNYQNDGDSVYRLFYDTVKGGDYRAREANVYRLAEVSNAIIDQCVAQGVPFAREYGGLLDNRSFGGAQVSRTFYAKGQTGQQLLLGAYSALSRQVNVGTVKLYTRYEMQDVVIVDGRARGIIAKNLVTGKLERFAAHAVVIARPAHERQPRLARAVFIVGQQRLADLQIGRDLALGQPARVAQLRHDGSKIAFHAAPPVTFMITDCILPRPRPNGNSLLIKSRARLEKRRRGCYTIYL